MAETKREFKRNLSKVRQRGRDELRRVQAHLVPVRTHSSSTNVYHCCVHRTASQWFRRLFADYRVYRYSGLRPHHYQSRMPGKHDPRPVTERRFDSPFPQRRIVSPLYVDYEGFRSIPKPDDYKAFYVLRDPRDVVVSWYFSARYSHRLMGDLAAVRPDLDKLTTEEGLVYSIEHLNGFGTFAAMDSWWVNAPSDPNVLLVRFEEITGPNLRGEFDSLLEHLDIKMPSQVTESLLDTYSFEALSGRKRGQEDRLAHYRSGTSGWEAHFTPRVEDALEAACGGLVGKLKY